MGLVLDLCDSNELGITASSGVQRHLVQSLPLLGRLKLERTSQCGMENCGEYVGETVASIFAVIKRSRFDKQVFFF